MLVIKEQIAASPEITKCPQGTRKKRLLYREFLINATPFQRICGETTEIAIILGLKNSSNLYLLTQEAIKSTEVDKTIKRQRR